MPFVTNDFYRTPMPNSLEQDQTAYRILVNQEEQYSIWPAQHALPLGWEAVGEAGTREACLARIEELWTDMRPLSLKRQMAASQP